MRCVRLRWCCSFAVSVAVLVAASGCSAPSPASGGAPAVTTTPSTTAAVATPAAGPSSTTPSLPPANDTPSSTAVESTSPSSATPSCSGTALAVTAPSEASGGAGHEGIVVVFTNRSGATCVVQGYPGAAGVNAAGAQVVQAARTLTGYLGGCHCSAPQAVPLAPGQQASSLLEGDSGGGDECLVVTSVLVTPPDTRTSTVIAMRVYNCRLQIHPVVPGTTGGANF